MKSGLRVALDEIRANCGAGELSLVDVSVAAEMRKRSGLPMRFGVWSTVFFSCI